jgi:integrase
MGHSVQTFLDTYAKWIDGGQDAVEIAKLEALISPETPRKTVDQPK